MGFSYSIDSSFLYMIENKDRAGSIQVICDYVISVFIACLSYDGSGAMEF